jgi:hypothetical protein
MGPIKQKSNRDEVRANIAAGGWAVAWGDLVNEFDVASGVIASVVPAIGTGAWVSQQITAQIQKFGQSLQDISPEVAAQATNLLQDVINKRFKGEWNIKGLGIKAGVAKYDRYWKIPPFGGWNNLPPNFQPYIGFRLTSPLPKRGASDESIDIQTVSLLTEGEPGPSPTSPPPSPIGTYEDINLGLTDEELAKVLDRAGHGPLPPAAVSLVRA